MKRRLLSFWNIVLPVLRKVATGQIRFSSFRPIKRRALSAGLAALLLVIAVSGPGVSGHGDEPGADDEADTSALQIGSVPTEKLRHSDLHGLNTGAISFAGELLSDSDRNTYPQRAGVIQEWRVAVGQSVKKGQVIARLSAPPVSIEQIAALAAQLQTVERAKAFATASEKIARDNEARLQKMRTVLDGSKESATLAAKIELEKTTVQNQGINQQLQASKNVKLGSVQSAQAELEAAKAELSAAEKVANLRSDAIRASAEQMLQITAPKLFSGGNIPKTEGQIYGSRLRLGVGGIKEQSVYDFLTAYQKVTDDLAKDGAAPAETASAFLTAVNDLLNYSIPSNDGITAEEIQDIREKLADKQTDFLDFVKEQKEAQAAVALKLAEVDKASSLIVKAGAEADQGITEKETLSALNALNIKTSQAQLDKILKDIDLEYQKQGLELDLKAADIGREVDVAKAEAQAAEAGYQSILSGAAGGNIVSPVAGVISSINVLTGQTVTPETSVATVTGPAESGKFVRFQIPADVLPPEVGDTFTIERQDYAFDRVLATVTGVGSGLNDQKLLTVQAKLEKDVRWPIHISVRVRPTKVISTQLTVPVGAIWLDAEAKPRVWIVTKEAKAVDQSVELSRSVGERVEVLGGLQEGDTVVSNASLPMKAGQAIDIPIAPKEVVAPAGDGHDHEH